MDTAVVMILVWVFLAFVLAPADAQQYEGLKSYMGNVIVNTPYGYVKGVTFTSQYENLPNRWVNAFLGVPYAKTLDQYGSEWREKYRFHNPDEDPYWYGTYDATKYKPACPQMPWLVRETVWGFNEVSEDCLYLDIYTPNITSESVSASPNLYPVLVFLHGGGFIMGASRQWPGVFLAERFVVVVVINYRLNALGFLSTGDRYSTGNYGMFDQVKALQFVKKTIRSFRLFNQAIMLSGSEMSEWAVIRTADSVEYARRLCAEVGCPTSDSQQMMDCLRYYRSFEQIVNASARVSMLSGKIGNPWGPVVDGPFVGVNFAFLPDPPADLRRQLRQLNIPLLAGMVSNEGAYFIPSLPNLIDGVTKTQFQNILDEFIRYRDIKDKNALYDALEFQYTYWPHPTNQTWICNKLIEMMGDYMFGAAMSATLDSHVFASTVFFYVFEYNSWNNYNPSWRGISHGQDLEYIFGFPFINDTYRDLLGIFPRQEYDYSDRNISEYMITMITNFTSTGEPTPRIEQLRFFRNVSWYQYNMVNHTYLSINNQSMNKINYRQDQSHFWNDYYPKLAGYSQYYYRQPVTEGPQTASPFQISTWALTAVGGVLLFVVICLVVLLICRSRTKNYPTYNPSAASRKNERADIPMTSDY
ncbi:unnamed protein product [Candidula unifasciata]|uniref:Carboxylesterase type B domain-containing protein n=1 Tax=Candidula unifasciata TaxID=100452 RepID=A0A8S3Z4Z5_9EUPU|nr:unnamed protein product [Candidula unifasciata]